MSARGHLTQLKLDEARFFLGYLAPNYGKERKFDFFLSAFISAARSVTWVMKAEYADVEGWTTWFESLAQSQEEAALLKGTTEARNRAQKASPLQTMTALRVEGLTVPEAELPRFTAALAKSPTGQLPAHVGGSPGKYFVEVEIEGERVRLPAATVIIDRRLKEFPDKNILAVCNAYYAALESLVRQCREKFDA
jgi:hypothetical protein